MASFLVRSVRATARQSIVTVYNRSYTVLSSAALSNSSSLFAHLRPLAMVVGSEEEARTKIYSVSTRHYFAVGALVSEELSYKLKGQPFINGHASPYELKYDQELVRNIAKANEWNKHDVRPRNFDISQILGRRDLHTANQVPILGGELVGNSGGPLGTATPPPLNACNTSMKLPSKGGQRNYGGVVPPQNSEKENILRPLSPHLPVYKPHLTSTLSIANRIFAIYLTSIIVYFHLIYLKLGPICLTHESIYNLIFYSSKLFLISAEISALALAYHIVIGVRHLLADFSGIRGGRGN